MMKIAAGVTEQEVEVHHKLAERIGGAILAKARAAVETENPELLAPFAMRESCVLITLLWVTHPDPTIQSIVSGIAGFEPTQDEKNAVKNILSKIEDSLRRISTTKSSREIN